MPIRSTNCRKYLIVKKATNAEVINPTKSCALKISKLVAIESATKNLNDVLTPLTQKLYKQENPEAQDDASVDESTAENENTVDAEFEEVKEEDK